MTLVKSPVFLKKESVGFLFFFLGFVPDKKWVVHFWSLVVLECTLWSVSLDQYT
jgi:hypothetical protein